jgi:DNA repair protein RecO (recombination protein O)
MPLQKTDAIILKSINHGETSKILTLYSREFGKITVIAKGARNIKSRFGGSLETLNYVSIVFYEKESRDIQILSQAEIIDPFKETKKNLRKTTLALAICELINQLEIGQEPNRLFFRLCISALQSINRASANIINILSAYRIHVLDIMGFKPDFYNCLGCNKKLHKTTFFNLHAGGIICDECKREDTKAMVLYHETLQFLRTLQKTHISKLSGISPPKKVQDQVEEFLRRYMQYHVEGVRDLKALKFLHQIQKENN